jgi:hypothetical protein
VILNLGRFPALIYLFVRTLFFNFMKKISFGGYGGRSGEDSRPVPER